MFTSMVFMGISAIIFRNLFSLEPISERDKESAAVFIFSGMCGKLKIFCNTKLQTIHKGGRMFFVWQNLVTDLLSLR